MGKVLVAVVMSVLAVVSSFAQTRATSQVRVRVVDANGAAVPSAAVTAENTATGLHRTATTDATGIATFNDVPLTGVYTFTAAHEGFANASAHDIHLAAGVAAHVELKLATAGKRESVTVTSTSDTLQTASSELADRFSARELNATPILGRKLTTVPLLDSSVRSARGTGDLFLGQTLFVINGAGRRQTTFSVDDGSDDDMWGRQSMFTSLPMSTVEEFEILRNPISAEYGRTSGSAINIVTRSGTNDLHGDFLGAWRPTQIEANNPLSSQKTGDKLAQGSATLSGPIARNRTYFLVSDEYTRDDRGAAVTSPLSATPIFVGHARDELFLARIDHRFSDVNLFTFRSNLDALKDSNPQDAISGISLPSTGRTFRRNTYTTEAALDSALNERTANEARLQWMVGSPITQFVPFSLSTQFSYPGYATIGQSQYASLLNHQYEAADTVTHAFTRHTLKAGAEFMESSSGGFGQEFGGGFLLGQFNVKPGIRTPVDQLTAADINSFQQTFGNQQYNLKDMLGAVFIDDTWQLSPSLTAELGLRYEADSFTDAHHNLAPRVGLSYKLPRSETVVRASYGVFYGEERTDLAAADKLNGPEGVLTFSAQPGQLGFPTTLAALPAYPAGATVPPRNITVRAGQRAYVDQFLDTSALHFFPAALLNPYSHQWTLAIERELGRGWLITADYLGQHTLDIERPVDLNAPAPFVRDAQGQTRSAAVADATRPIAPVPGGYRRIVAYVNDGQANYNGLQLDLRKRLSSRFSLLASYTWSHTIGDVETDVPSQDPNDSNQLGDYEKATSLLDQRHRLSFSGDYALPWGFTVGTWFTAAAGRPYNITVGSDVNGDGSNSDRPVIDGVVIPRNYGRGTPTYDLASYIEKNFRLSERVALSVRGEGYNLTNHLNVVGRNGTYGTGVSPLPSLGQPLAGIANVEPARQFQFQARVQF